MLSHTAKLSVALAALVCAATLAPVPFGATGTALAAKATPPSPPVPPPGLKWVNDRNGGHIVETRQ